MGPHREARGLPMKAVAYSADGIAIHYGVQGEGAPPIVLVHS